MTDIDQQLAILVDIEEWRHACMGQSEGQLCCCDPEHPNYQKLLALISQTVSSYVIGEDETESTRYGKRLPVTSSPIAFQKFYRNKLRAEQRQALERLLGSGEV